MVAHLKWNCLIAPNFAIGAVLMMRFAELAAPYFDTAEMYRTEGWSTGDYVENVIGEALEGKRDKVVIPTKFKAEAKHTRFQIMHELEKSLRRLRTDYVDIFLNHAVNDVERLQNAVELYRGDFLEGFAVREPAFDDWLRDTRTRLRERAMQALEREVDGRVVALHDLLAALAIRLLDELLDGADGLVLRQHAGELEEAGLHHGVDAVAHAHLTGHREGVARG